MTSDQIQAPIGSGHAGSFSEIFERMSPQVQARVRELVEFVTPAVAFVDEDLVIRAFSTDPPCRLGVDCTKLIGTPLDAVVEEKDLPGFVDFLDGADGTGSYEIRLNAGPQVLWMSVVALDLRHDPTVRGYLMTARNATPVDRAERVLRVWAGLDQVISRFSTRFADVSRAGMDRLLADCCAAITGARGVAAAAVTLATGEILHVHDLVLYADEGGEARRVAPYVAIPMSTQEVLDTLPWPTTGFMADPVRSWVVGHLDHAERLTVPDGAPCATCDPQGAVAAALAENLDVRGVCCSLFEPIRLHGHVVGVVCVFSSRQARFRTRDLDAVAGLATMIAAARERHEAEALVSAAYESTSSGTIHLDEAGIIVGMDAGAVLMLGDQHGVRAGDLLLGDGDRQLHEMRDLIVEGSAQQRHLRWIGRAGPRDVMTHLTLSGHRAAPYGLRLDDITQVVRREAEMQNLNELLLLRVAELSDTREELRRALEHASRAREEERRSLALALHDDVVQTLIAVGWELDRVTYDLPEGSDLRTSALNAKSMLSAGIDTLRRQSFDLMPPGLEQQGFPSAVQELLEHLSEADGLATRLELDGAVGRFEPRLELVAYRTVQELCRNVVKHASARTLVVRAQIDSGYTLRVQVIDDGVGFTATSTTAQPLSRTHFGVTSMRETLALEGGELSYRAAPDGGTEASFTLPLR